MLWAHLSSMEKAQRAELLRKRFRAIGGFAYVPSGKPRRFRYDIRGTPILMGWDSGNGRREDRAVDWIKEPDAKPSLTPKTKHNTGAPALTTIAQKAPKKLCAAFATAEAYLASRVRR